MNAQALAAIESFAAEWATWMVEMSLQVAVLAAAVAVLAGLCRRRSASFRYALWLVVLVRLAVPPQLSLPTGWGWWLREQEAPALVALHQELPAAPARQLPAGGAVPAFTPPQSSTPPLATVESEAPPRPSAAPDIMPLSAATADTIPLIRPSWPALILLGWAGVSLTLLGMLVVGAVRTRQWVRKASTQLEPRLLQILGRARWRLEFTQDVELRNSENCTTPLVVGWWRPVILLPASVPRELDDDELEGVLLHELNHILRRDALVNFVQAVLGALYFFHPVVWWANREIRRLREDACDEMTVAAMEGRRKAYGSALVKVSEILGYAAPPLALGVMEASHPAKRRLGRILDPNLPLGDRWSALSLVLTVMLATVFLPGGPPPSASQADDAPPAMQVAVRPEAAKAARAKQNLAGQDQPEPNAAAPADVLPVLRYGWKPGDSLAYSLTIEATDSEGIETRNGNVSYTVRAVDGERATIAVFGSMHGFRRPHPGMMFARRRSPFEFGSPFDERGHGAFPQERLLMIDRQGQVESMQGQAPLPFALGDLTRIAVLPLPARNSREWTSKAPIQLELENNDDPFPRSAFFRPPVQLLEAQESNRYRVSSWTDAQAIIERQVRTATLQRVGDKPRIAITGSGSAVFDRQAGVLESLQWNLTQVVQETHLARQTSIVVTCRRLTPTVGEVAVEPRLPQFSLPQAIQTLESAEPDRVLAALRVLQDSEPTQDRAAVATRLREFLNHQDAALREAGTVAWTRWADEQEVETLITLLDGDATAVRRSAMEALGRMRAAQAVEALAARLSEPADRVAASRALTQIGAASEQVLLPLLDHEAWPLRLSAIHILRDVGGARSLQPLKAREADDPQDNVRTWARLAIESIEQRLADGS